MRPPKLGEDVLLFYKDFEKDSFFAGDRYIKRILRPIYNAFKKTQKVSGFYVWYQLLIKSLELQGYNVHLNNYRLAKKNPDYPVGLVGYPHLLNDWSLPNPAVLGPCLHDHPLEAPRIMEDSRFKFYMLTSQWIIDMFKPYYGECVVFWYAGMDVSKWANTQTHEKTYDILIYDKVRWNREKYEGELINPIKSYLRNQGLKYTIIRYGRYDHQAYRDALSQSKAMIFLCEHETQGMAYQEALTSNLPVLAWDNGYWLDPRRPKFDPNPIPATSVPYFSPQCGEKFTDIANFPETFDKFWASIDSYEPRKFIERELSFAGSAELYMKYYHSAAKTNLANKLHDD